MSNKIQEEIDRYKEKIKLLNKKKNDSIKKDKETLGNFLIKQAKIDEEFKNKILEILSKDSNILKIFNSNLS